MSDVAGRVGSLAGLDRRSQRLTLLAKAAEHLLRGSGPEEVLPQLIGELTEILGLEIYERFELAGNGTVQRVSGNAPWQAAAVPATGTDVGREVCEEAVRRGRPEVRHDLGRAHPHDHEIEGGEGITAYGCFPLLADGEVLGAVSFATRGTARFDREAIELIQTIVDYLAVAERRLRYEADLRTAASELRDSEVQLRELAVDLVRAEQTERQRIAQMLHDDVQQLLFGAQMRLGLLREDVADGRLVDLDSLDEADRYLMESISKTRHLTAELAPTALGDDDLTEIIEPLVLQMREMHELEVEVRTGSPVVISDRSIRVVVHQTVRELLFNVVKHAGVSTVKINIGVWGNEIDIEVSDEGLGFEPDEVFADPARNKRGLATLRQRLRLAGGALSLESIPGNGTRARVRVPTRAGGDAST